MARYQSNARTGSRVSSHALRVADEEQLTEGEGEATVEPPELDNPFNKRTMVDNKDVGEKQAGQIFDPVDSALGSLVAEYDMFLNNPGKHLMLLQYPNRDPGQPYSERTYSRPLALRVKPKCGIVEVDVPITTQSYFDKEKGISYGEAIRKSRILQEGGSYGLTGGLRAGVGGGMRFRLPVSSDVASNMEEPSLETLLDNFEEASKKGHVMNKLTLGGQIVFWKNGDPIYMIGVFKGSKLATFMKQEGRTFNFY